MANPFNPLDWIKSTQNWFTRTERSSGFRPYLIFVILYIGFVLIVLHEFSHIDLLMQFVIYSLYVVFGGFVVVFIFKSVQDPDFCRSEKHVENIRRIELQEQKGDRSPQPLDITPGDLVPKQSVLTSREIEP